MMNLKFLMFFFFSLFFIFTFILILFIGLINLDEEKNSKSEECIYKGPEPTPLTNEVIGCSPPITAYSTRSETGYVAPCLVYFTTDIIYEKTPYGLRLPIGMYNVYVQYLSLSAIDGDVVVDRLIRTAFHPVQDQFVAEGFIGGEIATFTESKAMTEYNNVELVTGGNTLRLEVATKGASQVTVDIDRIEILFEKVT